MYEKNLIANYNGKCLQSFSSSNVNLTQRIHHLAFFDFNDFHHDIWILPATILHCDALQHAVLVSVSSVQIMIMF